MRFRVRACVASALESQAQAEEVQTRTLAASLFQGVSLNSRCCGNLVVGGSQGGRAVRSRRRHPRGQGVPPTHLRTFPTQPTRLDLHHDQNRDLETRLCTFGAARNTARRHHARCGYFYPSDGLAGAA
jgi:hypothetical protein